MAWNAYYRAWSTGTNGPSLNDAANHTINAEVNNAAIGGLSSVEVGDGLYRIELSDEQCPSGSRFAVYGSSQSSGVVIIGESGVRPLAHASEFAIVVTATSGDDVIEGVRVTLVGTGRRYHTGGNGIAQINVDPGQYELQFTPPGSGYEFVPNQTVEVVDENVAVAVELSPLGYEPAIAPLCNVVFPVIDQFGLALSQTTVSFRFEGYMEDADRSAVVMNPPRRQTSSDNGIVIVSLMRLARYTASYRVHGGEEKRVAIEVPAAGTYTVVEP
jgi:hypothetical protein